MFLKLYLHKDHCDLKIWPCSQTSQNGPFKFLNKRQSEFNLLNHVSDQNSKTFANIKFTREQWFLYVSLSFCVLFSFKEQFV